MCSNPKSQQSIQTWLRLRSFKELPGRLWLNLTYSKATYQKKNIFGEKRIVDNSANYILNIYHQLSFIFLVCWNFAQGFICGFFWMSCQQLVLLSCLKPSSSSHSKHHTRLHKCFGSNTLWTKTYHIRSLVRGFV